MKGQDMDRIKIEDSSLLLKYACDDLNSLRSVLQAIETPADCLDVRDLFAVVNRTLDPITRDIQRASDTICEELQKGSEG